MMTENLKPFGAPLPMFGRILFEADQNAGGDPDAMPTASDMVADLDAIKQGGTPEAGAESQGQEQVQPEGGAAPATPAPAAPAAQEPAVDWKAKYEEREKNYEQEYLSYAERAYQQRLEAFARQSPANWKLVHGKDPE